MSHFEKQLSAQEIKQGYALLNLMRAELPSEVTHPATLKDCLIVS